MKRHLPLLLLSILPATAPLMAQGPYVTPQGSFPPEGYSLPYDHPDVGYAAEPDYAAEPWRHGFNFSPDPLMNGTNNPPSNPFDPANGTYGDGYYGYDTYAAPRAYPYPHAYPYSYPLRPYAYPQPPDYGYTYGAYSAPYGQYPGYYDDVDPYAWPAPPQEYLPEYAGYPPAGEGEPLPPQAPDYATPAPAYPGQATPPDSGNRYRFRPLNTPPRTRRPPSPESVSPPQALLQPMPPDTRTHEGKAMKFRPMDKPGYIQDLDK